MASVVDEQLLDDADALAAADPSQVLRALATAGAQVREALTLSAEARLDALAEQDRPRAVVVASLGGSALVADVLAALAGAGSPVPVTVRRAMPLPGWVGPLDLVVAVSLSGRARGPLALAAEAARRGSRLLTVGASGSPLADVCARAHGVHVPAGHNRGSSRTALWSLVVPVLQAADALGLADVPTSAVEEAAQRLDEEAEACRPSSEAFVNPAKALALELSGTVPLVLADGELTGVAATRAAAMLARTARIPAARGALPYDASEVVATFGGPYAAGDGLDDVFADPFEGGPSAPRQRLLLLRDAPDDDTAPGAADRPGPELDRQALASAVRVTAEESGVRVSELTAEPGAALARLAALVARTDFAATYLALGLGLDPAKSPQVAELRAHLGG